MRWVEFVTDRKIHDKDEDSGDEKKSSPEGCFARRRIGKRVWF